MTDSQHVFDLFLSESCHGWPGPGAEHVYTMNPMKEFVENHEAHVLSSFNTFQQEHSREYTGIVERTSRLETFRQNLRFIHSTNRAGRGYQLASNHLADRTEGELAVLRGYRATPGSHGGEKHVWTPEQAADTHIRRQSADTTIRLFAR